MFNRFSNAIAVTILFGTFVAEDIASADEAPCSLIRAALEKVNTTERLQVSYRHTFQNGEFITKERIIVDWMEYGRSGEGPWITGMRFFFPLSDANAPPLVSDCRKVGDETLDGVPTAVVSYRWHHRDVVSDSRMWIAHRTNLPLRAYSKIIGNEPLTEVVSNYTYDTNISAPDYRDP